MTDTPSKQPDPAEEVAVAPPCAMVIFGAAGDLTRRLVVPALYNLINAGRLPNEFRLVGIDLVSQTAEDWRKNLTEAMKSFVGRDGEFQVAHIDESAPGPCHPTASQSTVYAQNKILDVNKDGVITTGDVQESVMRKIRAASGRVRFDPNTPPEAPPSKGLAPLTLVVIGGAAYVGAKLLGWA